MRSFCTAGFSQVSLSGLVVVSLEPPGHKSSSSPSCNCSIMCAMLALDAVATCVMETITNP